MNMAPTSFPRFWREFHGGRHLGSKSCVSFQRSAKCGSGYPLITNRQILSYTYRRVPNIGERFLTTHRGQHTAQHRERDDGQHQRPTRHRDREPTSINASRIVSLGKRHWDLRAGEDHSHVPHTCLGKDTNTGRLRAGIARARGKYLLKSDDSFADTTHLVCSTMDCHFTWVTHMRFNDQDPPIELRSSGRLLAAN